MPERGNACRIFAYIQARPHKWYVIPSDKLHLIHLLGPFSMLPEKNPVIIVAGCNHSIMICSHYLQIIDMTRLPSCLPARLCHLAKQIRHSGATIPIMGTIYHVSRFGALLRYGESFPHCWQRGSETTPNELISNFRPGRTTDVVPANTPLISWVSRVRECIWIIS